jgi:transcriptional regulator with XRE-family HTH domain
MSRDRPGFASTPTEADRQTLGERLRVAREYVGLKQEEVAKQLRIPRSALSNIEAGQRKVDALELTRLAKLYQRPVTWFTGKETAVGTKRPSEVAYLAKAAESLSRRDRQELARFADFLKLRAQAKAGNDGR